MPIPSPVHDVVAPLCHSYRWKDWAGYHAVCSFEPCPEREYFAFRHGAGLIDVSPLFKYEVTGPDAARFLSRIVTRDISKLKDESIVYCCWCDDQGYVVDDGTIAKINDQHFRLTAAEPSLAWFSRFSRGFQVDMKDVSQSLAALSLQGPNSRVILCSLFQNDLSLLKYFKLWQTSYDGASVTITRTGYTGDLGYELWLPREKASRLYQELLFVGEAFGIKACGLDAMDITRIEAGYIMNGVDYYSANHCITDARKSTPFELGLHVNLDRDVFNGQASLRREKAKGPKRRLVGLDIDWVQLEKEFARHDLPPELSARAWRDGRPVYDRNQSFIGFASSGTWSPTLKKNIALAHLKPEFASIGQTVNFEITVEYERRHITATVVDTPFYNPERKRL
jgi:aminomethyltransferase